MERPDTCHVPSQTTSGREKKQKLILDIIRYYQKVSDKSHVLSRPRSGRGKTKTTSSLSKSSDIIKQEFDKSHVPPQATSAGEKTQYDDQECSLGGPPVWKTFSQ